MEDVVKQKIDDMSYIDMLSLWRHAPLGNPLFLGETGKYYTKVMKQKRSEISDQEHVAASKFIGWGTS